MHQYVALTKHWVQANRALWISLHITALWKQIFKPNLILLSNYNQQLYTVNIVLLFTTQLIIYWLRQGRILLFSQIQVNISQLASTLSTVRSSPWVLYKLWERPAKEWFQKLRKGPKRAFKKSLVAQRLKRLPGMRETGVRSLGREDPLEKAMAPHSSTLAWRIPWIEEPGGYSLWSCKE